MLDLYKRIIQINKEAGDRPIVLKTLKLQEEAGEVAEAVLKLENYKPTTKSDRETIEDISEESVDALLVSLDILAHYGVSFDEIEKIANRKCDKWEENIKKLKSKN